MVRVLFADLFMPAGLALIALVTLGGLMVVGQTLLQVPVVPGPVGLGRLFLGLLPTTLVLALPVAALVGSVAAGRAWREGGDLLALATSGHGARRLLLPLLGLGLFLGGLEAVLTHGLEPWGRTEVRRVLAQAAGQVRPRAGQPVQLGSTMLHVTQVEGSRLVNVFLADGQVVAAAASGTVEPGGQLALHEGSAMGLGDGATLSWRLNFDSAVLTLPRAEPRVELNERSGADLQGLVTRMEARGREAHAERLALYKRTALPFCLPLLLLIGLPLGTARARPAVVALVVTLGWWAVMRVFDQLAGPLGPLVAATAPGALLLLAVVLLWSRWAWR